MNFDDDADDLEETDTQTGKKTPPSGSSSGGPRRTKRTEPEVYEANTGYDTPQAPVREAPVPDRDYGVRKRKDTPKFTIGSALGIISVIMIIVGILMPWYYVDGSISSDKYDTGGRQNVLTIGGYSGIYWNFPEDKTNNASRSQTAAEIKENVTSELESLPGFHICGTCMLIFIVLLVLHEVWVIVAYLRSDKTNRGNKFIWHSLGIIIPLVLLFVGLPYLVSLILSNYVGDTSSTHDVIRSVNQMASTVISGSTTFSAGSNGTVKVWWGMAVGMWLIISGAVLCLIAGVLDRFLS